MAAQGQRGLPVSHQGVLKSVSSGPGSHPLTLQQVEQSMGFSTSSGSAASGTAPVQALAKGKHVDTATAFVSCEMQGVPGGCHGDASRVKSTQQQMRCSVGRNV